MRVVSWLIAAGVLILAPEAWAQPAEQEQARPAEDAVAEADTENTDGPPLALVPVISVPLEPVATGAPIRLEPYKPAAAPRRPLPPSQPAVQARPR